jgi:hypothetical protein
MQHCRYSSERKEGQARYIFFIDIDAVGSRRQRAIDFRQAERLGKRQGRRLAPCRHCWKAPVLLTQAVLVADGGFNAKAATVAAVDFIVLGFASPGCRGKVAWSSSSAFRCVQSNVQSVLQAIVFLPL